MISGEKQFNLEKKPYLYYNRITKMNMGGADLEHTMVSRSYDQNKTYDAGEYFAC